MKSDNSLSETLSQEEAEEILEAVLHDETETMKAMIREMWDRDRIDFRSFYRLVSRDEEAIRQEENLPPLNLPP